MSHKVASVLMFLILSSLVFGKNILLNILDIINPSLVDNTIYYQSINSIIFFSIPIIVYMLYKKISLKNILKLQKISFKNIICIIFLSIFFQPLFKLIASLTIVFSRDIVGSSINSFLEYPFWQLIIVLVVLPAILEEIVFRGIFLKEYENSPFWFGILFSSLFFAMMHLTISQFFYAFLGGLIMSLLVKVTNSIFSSMLFHFILNGTQITLAYISSQVLKVQFINLDNISMEEKLNLLYSNLILFIVTIPFLILFIYLFFKINKDNISNLKREISSDKGFKENPFNIFFLNCVLLYLLFLM